MKKKIACLALLLSVGMIPAFAADLVYVSFNGVDTNPCTRASPCKTITHGLSLVAAGGRVDIIGSGKYDVLMITKSVTVSAEPGSMAILEVPASANGIKGQCRVERCRGSQGFYDQWPRLGKRNRD